MISIAHRANLVGPNPSAENQPDVVEELLTLCPWVDVEVDLWSIGQDYFLGHDGPEHRVSVAWLDTYAPRLWIHAKNPAACMECILHHWRCFAHDTDRYVLTSTGQLWTYPDAKTMLTASSVIVMPEWINENVRVYNELHTGIYGVCTDLVYDLMCQGVTSPALWRKRLHAKLASPIPTSFRGHHPQDLELGRCLAVFHPLKSTDFSRTFAALQKRLVHDFPDDIHYGFEGEPGWPHWTLSQTKTFTACARTGLSPTELEQTESRLRTVLKSCVRAFDILWYGVVATPTGLIMLGLPTFTDVNELRAQLTDEAVPAAEQYHNTLVHASLLRFREGDVSQSRHEQLQAICETFGQRLFGRSRVDHFNVAECSWLMSPQQWQPSVRVVPLSSDLERFGAGGWSKAECRNQGENPTD